MAYNPLKTISAKDLGKILLPNFCPRCFWIERHCGKAPSIFPGIFSTLDMVSKKGTHRAFDEVARPPKWLEVKDAVEVERGSLYYKLPVEAGSWILKGYPDDILKLKDGSYHIIDYKTAKYTERQDELLPMYEVQLNTYAFLARKYGLSPVSKLSLVYCEPHSRLDHFDEFTLSFDTYRLDIERNEELVFDLLKKAREIVSSPAPPKRNKKCKKICRWLEESIIELKRLEGEQLFNS